MSGIVPAGHYILSEGLEHAMRYAAFGWLMLMALLYMCGAALYAFRIPECLWPGKFDIWVRNLLLKLKAFARGGFFWKALCGEPIVVMIGKY